MKTSRNFLRFYTVPIALFFGVLLIAAFTIFYTVTTRTRDGALVKNDWPKTFTADFSGQIVFSGGAPSITDEGQALLSQNNLWLQLLNERGEEVFNYRKPDGVPAAYEPFLFLNVYQNGISESSVFVGTIDGGDGAYAYLIGFPLAISKVVMYVDRARYDSGKILIVTLIALTAVLVLTLSVYAYTTFQSAEKRRAQDEKAKEEWLANITHDLKTPLAPIRGYAELLSEAENSPDIRNYGAIMLKNALYAELLVDDLKLTYQLQSDMLPLRLQTQSLTRFVREAIIDLLNAPEYENRRVAFSAPTEDIQKTFDACLLRRALFNILANALKHNGPETEITVTIKREAQVKMIISDDGRGMTPDELSGLFTRYYRGTNTQSATEGSGLGMAIAKQIITAHGFSVSAQSAPGAGTTIVIALPI